jgi:hypothetical protein
MVLPLTAVCCPVRRSLLQTALGGDDEHVAHMLQPPANRFNSGQCPGVRPSLGLLNVVVIAPEDSGITLG